LFDAAFAMAVLDFVNRQASHYIYSNSGKRVDGVQLAQDTVKWRVLLNAAIRLGVA